jgi:hypothetical protein
VNKWLIVKEFVWNFLLAEWVFCGPAVWNFRWFSQVDASSGVFTPDAFFVFGFLVTIVWRWM